MKRPLVIAAILCLALETAAYANSFTTLTFKADPGWPTVLNGSTITIDPANNIVLSWDFTDLTSVPALSPDVGFGMNSELPSGSYNGFLCAPGGLLNVQLGTSDTGPFTGTFATSSFTFPLGFLDFVTPTSLDDEFVMWPNNDPTQTPLIIGHDIQGTWLGTIPNIVPDAANTSVSLLGAAALMGLCHRRLRGSALV